MRRILVDAARARRARKRGSGKIRVNIDEASLVSAESDDSVLLLHEALEALAKLAPRQAKVVELRYFGGMNTEEIVEVMKISARTVERDWEFSRVWLKREMGK